MRNTVHRCIWGFTYPISTDYGCTWCCHSAIWLEISISRSRSEKCVVILHVMGLGTRQGGMSCSCSFISMFGHETRGDVLLMLCHIHVERNIPLDLYFGLWTHTETPSARSYPAQCIPRLRAEPFHYIGKVRAHVHTSMLYTTLVCVLNTYRLPLNSPKAL